MLKKEARKILIAVAIALLAVALVIAFVAGQEPDAPAPTLESPKLAPVVLAPEAGEDPSGQKAEAPEPRKDAAEPGKDAAEPRKDAPAPERPGRAEKRPEPEARRHREARRAEVPPPRPPPKKQMVSPAGPRGDGFKVKFRSLEALEALVEGDHVAVVVEYPDGARLLLPRELDGELVTIDVPADAFEGWVEERRVSELEPTPALLDRLRVHAEDVRYLAVLSPALRDAIAREAEAARVDAGRSVMVIDAERGHPQVSVLLARR